MDYEEKIENYLKKVGMDKEKDIKRQLVNSIRRERERKTKVSVGEIISQVRKGKFKEVSLDLTLLSRPRQFCDSIEILRKRLDKLFNDFDASFQKNSFLFLMKMTINLKSFLPYWSLRNEDLFQENCLSEEEIDHQISENRVLLNKWERENGNLKKEVFSLINKETEERFESEDVNKDDLKEIVYKTVGDNIDNFLDQMFNFIETSNLEKITKMRNDKTTLTEIGNDYAAHLYEAMLLGASFVTTNPQLAYVNFERKLDISEERIDDLIRQFLQAKNMVNTVDHMHEAVEEFTDIFTAEVVINNASLLRDIFLLTDGKMGYVCFQVNPIHHGNVEKMLDEALSVYTYLYDRLGGIPNVVFKLPGTKAGLEVEEILTNLGIGANITVEFGLFQIIPFAKAINSDRTITSHLTVMNGRLAFPVRDELLGLGIPNAREAAQWAGVAVGKKAYDLLYSKGKLGFDPAKIKLLIASLRNYNNFFPDITELMGAPIVTVFPNIRNQFDSNPHDIDPMSIQNPVDVSILKSLCKSEIFKQAYYLPGDSEEFKPELVLSLDKTEEVQNWIPVKGTLGAFIQARKITEKKLQERMEGVINS